MCRVRHRNREGLEHYRRAKTIVSPVPLSTLVCGAGSNSRFNPFACAAMAPPQPLCFRHVARAHTDAGDCSLATMFLVIVEVLH